MSLWGSLWPLFSGTGTLPLQMLPWSLGCCCGRGSCALDKRWYAFSTDKPVTAAARISRPKAVPPPLTSPAPVINCDLNEGPAGRTAAFFAYMPDLYIVTYVCVQDECPFIDHCTCHIPGTRHQKVRAIIRSKRSTAMRKYLSIAKPRDYRFAQRVHGAALAPQWSDIWTDDTAISSNPRANAMDRDIRSAVTESLKSNIKTVLKNMKNGDTPTETKEETNGASEDETSANRNAKPSIDIEYVQDIQKKVQKLIPKDTPRSRLSNMVIDQEQLGISRMRHFVRNRLRRHPEKAYELYAVDALLDLANYGHDAHVLARSLRRDDLTYSTFGHFVGCLMAQARHTDGRVGAGIVQLRMLNSRVTEAMFECVSFLSTLERPIVIDEIGQPDVKTLYAINGEPLVLVGNNGKAEVVYTQKGLQIGDRLQIADAEKSSDSGNESDNKYTSNSSSTGSSPREVKNEPTSNPAVVLGYQ
eukprot:2078339-Rhodomonas_salina.4